MARAEMVTAILDSVEGLWPGARVTAAQVGVYWDEFLYRFSLNEIAMALRAVRSEDLDAARPKWNGVRFHLKALRRNDSETSSFQRYLSTTRDLAEKQRIAGSENWSDEEVFSQILRMITFPITHDPISKRPHDDPEGRRAKMAAERRQSHAQYWAESLRAKGRTVPDFLMTDVPDGLLRN